MKYVSLDLETSGLDTSFCQILEIGAVVDDLDKPHNPELVAGDFFHCYVTHPKIVGQPYALMMNADIIKVIAEGKHQNLKTPDEAADALKKWLQFHFGSSSKVTAAGKNFQGFDKPFLEAQFPKTDFLFHHRCFDATTSFYQKGDKALPDLKTCLERANITLPFKLHTALDDARAVIALLRHIHK